MPVLIPATSEHQHSSWSATAPSQATTAITLIPDFAAYLQPRVRRLTVVSDARARSASASVSPSPSPAASPSLRPAEPDADADAADVLQPSVRTTFLFPRAIGHAEYAAVDALALELFQACGLTPYHSGFITRADDTADTFATRLWVQTAPRNTGEFEPAVVRFIRAVLAEADLEVRVSVEDEVW